MIKASEIKFTRKGEYSVYKHGDKTFRVRPFNKSAYILKLPGSDSNEVKHSLDDCRAHIAAIISMDSPFVGHWNASMAAAVNMCRAINDVRFYLKGVYVAPHPDGGVLLAGTNGHLIGLAHDPDGYVNRPAIIDFDSKFVAQHKHQKGDCSGRRTMESDGRIVYMTMCSRYVDGKPVDTESADDPQALEYGDFGKSEFGSMVKAMQPFQEVKGKYPDLSKIIPKEIDTSVNACGIDGKYLELANKFIKTGSSISGSIVSHLVISGTDKGFNGPRLITFNCCKNLAIVIMPLRTEDEDLTMPKFLHSLSDRSD